MSVHLWVRAETKHGEERTPVVPAGVRALRAAGIDVSVERSATRAIADAEFAAAGATLVSTGSWRTAPRDATVLGIKELPAPTSNADAPLVHRHVFFAHAFKEQAGWQGVLRRFVDGGGTLLDLEYLKNPDGRRVAAFGYWAGYVGAAVGVLALAQQRAHPDEALGVVRPWRSQDALVQACRAALLSSSSSTAEAPLRAIVLGSKGRSGSGAIALLQALGASVTAWDLEETRGGGPFAQILTHDLFVNAVLVMGPMAPFLTRTTIDGPRALRVVADVSCDPHSPYNPVPIYDDITTMEQPTVRAHAGRAGSPPLDVVAIDHLPSLLPRESSEDFAAQLLPHLLTLGTGSSVWSGAEQVFRDKIQGL